MHCSVDKYIAVFVNTSMYMLSVNKYVDAFVNTLTYIFSYSPHNTESLNIILTPRALHTILQCV